MSNNTNTPTNMSSTPTKNVIAWFEIPVSDIARARRLYESMLDTKLPVSDFGGVPHAILSNADHSCVSGALVQDPKKKPSREGTTLYLVATDGIARCLSRGVEAGAKVALPRTAIGEHGFIALIEDLDGNIVGLHEELAK
jgi:uncharacterized protein